MSAFRRCAGCRAYTPTDLHHLVRRSQGGKNVLGNLVPLCGSGTTGCHGIYTSHNLGTDGHGHRRGWLSVASTIRSSLTSEQEDYVVAVKSQDFLEHAYPREGA